MSLDALSHALEHCPWEPPTVMTADLPAKWHWLRRLGQVTTSLEPTVRHKEELVLRPQSHGKTVHGCRDDHPLRGSPQGSVFVARR
jgi:hypothetical protein